MLEYGSIWQTATIFISSTFQDMQFERDCINKIVLPALREYFKPYKIAVRVIDLRWGINTIDNAENDIESKIIDVCLNEIDRSRPFFVGIIGNRYGWIPPAVLNSDTKSVTEMEIDYGALQNKESLENSIICIRDIDNVPDELYSIYYENETIKKQKVKELRKRLSSIYADSSINKNFESYTASWNYSTQTLEGLSLFSDFLIVSLKRLICKRFNLDSHNHLTSHKSNYEILDSFFGDYIHSCLTTYIRRSYLEKEAIGTISNNRLCYITGSSGNGKSALLCRLFDLMIESSNSILYYNESISTALDKRLECLTLWDYKLSSVLDFPFEESIPSVSSSQMLSRKLVVRSDINFRLTRLQDMSKKLSENNYSVICLIDSTNSHLKNDFIKLIYESLPAFSFVVAMPGSSTRYSDSSSINVPPFNEEEIGQYLIRQFDYYDKELHNSVIRAITHKILNRTGNVLWLSIMTYLLLNLNAEDFAAISSSNKGSGEENIEDYFINLIEESPDNSFDLFKYLYNKSVSQFDEYLIKQSLVFLSVSKNGLRDEDLERLLGVKWDPIAFAYFRRWFSPFLIESTDNKRWKFSSSLFKKSVQSLNLSESLSNEKALAELLWNYDFYEPIRYADLFYHLMNCQMYDRCGQMIISSNVNYIEPIREVFESLSSSEDIEALVYNISVKLSTEDRVLAVSKLLILVVHNLFYQNIKSVLNIVDVLLQNVDIESANLSDFALMSISALLEEVILFIGRFGNDQDGIKYSESLLNIALYRDSIYPSKESKTSISASAYTLGKYYLSRGDMDRANDYFKLI